MEIYIAQQTTAFLWAIFVGAALGLLYDSFRILRIAIPCGNTFIAVQDVLFFITCALVTFLFLLGQAEGKVRFFLLVGELLGGVLYFSTISIPIMGVSRKIIAVIRAVISFIARYLLLPLWRLVYWIVSTILRPVRFLGRKIKAGLLKIKLLLLKWHKLLYNRVNDAITRRSGGNGADEEESR
jgi:spore cortex biosynthesis protein YabQ